MGHVGSPAHLDGPESAAHSGPVTMLVLIHLGFIF